MGTIHFRPTQKKAGALGINQGGRTGGHASRFSVVSRGEFKLAQGRRASIRSSRQGRLQHLRGGRPGRVALSPARSDAPRYLWPESVQGEDGPAEDIRLGEVVWLGAMAWCVADHSDDLHRYPGELARDG